MMNELDKINMIRQAERRALAKGQEKGEKLGLKKGRASRNIEIARNMLSLGLSDDIIVQSTGLTSAQIDGLKQKN